MSGLLLAAVLMGAAPAKDEAERTGLNSQFKTR
jgi:hypothetical protein